MPTEFAAVLGLTRWAYHQKIDNFAEFCANKRIAFMTDTQGINITAISLQLARGCYKVTADCHHGLALRRARLWPRSQRPITILCHSLELGQHFVHMSTRANASQGPGKSLDHRCGPLARFVDHDPASDPSLITNYCGAADPSSPYSSRRVD